MLGLFGACGSAEINGGGDDGGDGDDDDDDDDDYDDDDDDDESCVKCYWSWWLMVTKWFIQIVRSHLPTSSCSLFSPDPYIDHPPIRVFISKSYRFKAYYNMHQKKKGLLGYVYNTCWPGSLPVGSINEGSAIGTPGFLPGCLLAAYIV